MQLRACAQIKDVSDALDQLLCIFTARASSCMAPEPDVCRRQGSYLQATCETLKRVRARSHASMHVHSQCMHSHAHFPCYMHTRSHASMRTYAYASEKPTRHQAPFHVCCHLRGSASVLMAILLLPQHEPTLRRIFDMVAKAPVGTATASSGDGAGGAPRGHRRSPSPSKARGSELTASAEQWLHILRTHRLLDDVSEKDALRAYCWSLMVVRDPDTAVGRRKETLMPFESFLEALCHMARMKALPSAAELAQVIACHGRVFSVRHGLR